MRRAHAAGVAALSAILLLPGAAQSQAGEPERGFGTRGSVVTDLQDRSGDRCFELLVQPDSKLVCVGQSVRRGSQHEDVALVRYQPNGQLDQSFGVGGISLFDSGLGMDEIAASAVLAPDGKIVVAGVADVAGPDRQDIFVARFSMDGRIDPSFGGRGFVTTDASPKSPDLDWGNVVALQADGKIVVAGQTDGLGAGVDGVLVRYTAAGELDRSFAGDGLLVHLTGDGGGEALALLIQPDEKIVVASPSENEGTADAILARVHGDGRPDGSFGTGGISRIDPGLIGTGEVRSLLRQPDGKIVAAGWLLIGPYPFSSLTRLHPNGRLDPSFGNRGSSRVKLTAGLPESGVYAADLQSDGKIVVAGGTGGRFLVARYSKSGKVDMSFGGIGFAATSAGGRNRSYASAVRIQADGWIVAAGAASVSGNPEDFALVRIDSRTPAATRFASFTVQSTRKGSVVRWRTRSELDTRRFLLYRQQSGRQKLIGRFAARGGTARGASYSSTDREALKFQCCPAYWLVEVKRNGRQVRYGPVAR